MPSDDTAWHTYVLYFEPVISIYGTVICDENQFSHVQIASNIARIHPTLLHPKMASRGSRMFEHMLPRHLICLPSPPSKALEKSCSEYVNLGTRPYKPRGSKMSSTIYHLQFPNTSYRSSDYSTSMSSATITGIAVFENPRMIERTKVIVVDAQMYLGADTSLSLALRYFNQNDLCFDEMGLYFVHASVSLLFLPINQLMIYDDSGRWLKWRRVLKFPQAERQKLSMTWLAM